MTLQEFANKMKKIAEENIIEVNDSDYAAQRKAFNCMDIYANNSICFTIEKNNDGDIYETLSIGKLTNSNKDKIVKAFFGEDKSIVKTNQHFSTIYTRKRNGSN